MMMHTSLMKPSCTLFIALCLTFEFAYVHNVPHSPIPGRNEMSVGGSLEWNKQNTTDIARIKSIVDWLITKIDLNGDQNISFGELKNWIYHVVVTSAKREAMLAWKLIKKANDTVMNWEEYVGSFYGLYNDTVTNEQHAEELWKLLRQDSRRWHAADLDRDNRLEFSEFINFLHPELQTHMRDTVIEDLIEAIDKNGDMLISEWEYMDELLRAHRVPGTHSGIPEPMWVKRQQEQFHEYLDSNKDNFLNRAEVGEWILPKGYDGVNTETEYLFLHLDSDQNGLLTFAEIMEQVTFFAHSMATNFGKIMDYYDEL
ncbi:Calumenin-B [Paragonimus heterotremus]|uniref:Reticulocalbin-3 n=1 Tax=Paragonimus heterotremus TaxID=100268 RepID=A0A8J4SPL3_9TREM|nr:Calumenin-B [Paragonimus heterotremus]